MSKYIKQHCRSPFITTICDHFTMPHRLYETCPPVFKDISFQAIVYPTTGTSIGRLRDPTEWREPSPYLPFTLQCRQRYISQVIQGMSALHGIGVVHAGR